jgi:hypothetical protein
MRRADEERRFMTVLLAEGLEGQSETISARHNENLNPANELDYPRSSGIIVP